jgi:hypothetical protein
MKFEMAVWPIRVRAFTQYTLDKPLISFDRDAEVFELSGYTDSCALRYGTGNNALHLSLCQEFYQPLGLHQSVLW